MTFNTISNKIFFLNTPLSFSGDRFKILKVRFKSLIQSFDFELWEIIMKKFFIPTHHINGEESRYVPFIIVYFYSIHIYR